jgi:hypothetical protein
MTKPTQPNGIESDIAAAAATWLKENEGPTPDVHDICCVISRDSSSSTWLDIQTDFRSHERLIQEHIATALGEDPIELFGEENSAADIANHFRTLTFPQIDTNAPSQENDIPADVREWATPRRRRKERQRAQCGRDRLRKRSFWLKMRRNVFILRVPVNK